VKRPNFILFITDQQRADFLGCYGHPILKTPNIDRIAAGGVAFDRFYVASPVCMANRASLMTGRMPSVHGVRSNGIPLSRKSVTFVELLRDAGYETALIGKSHLQNFTPHPSLLKATGVPEGYREPKDDLAEALRHDLGDPAYGQERPDYWRAPDAAIRTPFYGFDHVELVTGHGDGLGGDYARWLLQREPNARNLIGPENALSSDYSCPQAVRTAIPPELYSSAWIGERAREYLGERDGDAPFFLMVSFTDPHHPFNPPGRYWDMYDPDDFPVPEAFRRNDWTPPPHVAAAIAMRDEGRAELNGMNTIAVTAREAQEAQALTCGMIACLDDAVGEVLDALDASGQADDTVLIFTSDHGDHLGDHRLLLKGAEQYQSILRVPFIWAEPDEEEKTARRTSALGSTIDIPATILDHARIAPYAGMQGRSLIPVIQGTGRAVRDSAFVQFDSQRPLVGKIGPARVHSLIDEQWRISIYHGMPWGELYELRSDPGEFVNLWDSSGHAPAKLHLLEKLARAEIEHVDRVPLPTGRA
jgi:arylsulfatase A-like enzyme